MSVVHGNAGNDHWPGPGTTTSRTFAFDVGTGADRGLSVFVTIARIGGGSVTGLTITCTYAGVNMTDTRSGTSTGTVLQTSSTSAGACMFYLANPASGSNNIVVTVSSTVDHLILVAESVTGTSGANNFTSTTSNGATNSPTLGVTSASGDMAVGGASHGDTISGAGGTTTQRAIDNFANTTAGSNAIIGTSPGAATSNIDFTSSVSDHWVMLAHNWQSAAGAPPPDLLTVSAGGTGNSATSTTTLAFNCGATFDPGDVIVVVISADNNGTSGATSLSSVTDVKGHTYTLVQATYDPGAAAAGQTLGFAYTTVTTAMIGTDQITVNLSPATTAKAAVVHKLHPDTGAVIEKVGHGFGAGSATGTPSITTASIVTGQVVIGGLAVESNAAVTADADTTNGAWGTQATATGNTGTVATSSRVASQAKIVTATATQTYNPTQTSADCIDGWIAFHASIVNAVIVNPVTAVQRAASW